MQETAKTAFETFARAKGYATRWDDLPEAEKAIWREVAHSVFRHGWHEEAAKPPQRLASDSSLMTTEPPPAAIAGPAQAG